MISSAIVIALGFLGLSRVNALPVTSLEPRATRLSSPQLSAIVPFAQFARAAYCPTSRIDGWQCGGESLRLEPPQWTLFYDF